MHVSARSERHFNMFCKNVLLDSQMLFYDNSAKNDTFRIFYAKLYKLLSVDGSTIRHNEITFGGHYNYQIQFIDVFILIAETVIQPGRKDCEARFNFINLTIRPTQINKMKLFFYN